MKEVTCKAWEIAKNAAKKFGGKAIEYIGGALKMAWKMAKGLSEKQIKAIKVWIDVKTREVEADYTRVNRYSAPYKQEMVDAVAADLASIK